MRGKTPEDRRLLDLLDPVAEAAGYEIVRLRLSGAEQARRLQIMAERPDGSMLVEDCAALSRAIGTIMDDADPLAGEYLLEVSSPGMDRPLTRLKDFEAWEGFEARIELDRLADGRKRFRGELAGVDGDSVAINLDGDEEATTLLPFEWISDARLVINDALLAHGARERAERKALDAGEEPPVLDDIPPPPRGRPAKPGKAKASGSKKSAKTKKDTI